jgi:hypothetical protein
LACHIDWHVDRTIAQPAVGGEDLSETAVDVGNLTAQQCLNPRDMRAPEFREVPGLVRKQFIYAEDGWADGVYLWESRQQAEGFYSGPWLDGIRERYGMDPVIRYFHTAAITDNREASVVFLAAAE